MKKIIVTGSSSGFGLLIVQVLALKGHTVYATMRDMHTRNIEVAQSLGNWAKINNVDVRIVELDVTSDTSVDKAMSQIIDDAGQIDVLINNAGILTWGFSETVSTKQMEHIFQVNVFGSDRMNKAVLPYMHQHNSGLIIQLSAGLSRLHLPCLGVYSATKAAIDTLAETLHYELKGSGIDSIIIQPGIYPATDLFNKQMPADSPGTANCYSEFESGIMLGIRDLFTRMPGSQEPEEIAQLIAEIIDSPRDQRKLWTAIGIGVGDVYVDAINENTYIYSQRMQKALKIYSYHA